MLPSLASLGLDTDALGKRKLGEEESEEEKHVRLFREFLATPPQGPTFDGSSIDTAKLLADTDRLLLGKAAEDEPDDAAWSRALLSFVAKHPQYAEHSEEMLDDVNVIGDVGQSLSYVRSWPPLSSWTDDELRFARFAVERAFRNSMGRTDLHSMALGPQTFHLMPPKTFWSLWQMRRMDCVLTIRDVMRVRSTNTAIAVIPYIFQNQGSPTFTWLTADDFMFSADARTPQIGYFYPYEPNKRPAERVKWSDYARLESEGRLNRLLDAYAVSGSGADYWIKLSPELIGLAYGWMAQAERASARDVETHGLSGSIPSRVGPAPPWLDAIEEDEGEEGEAVAFPIPDAATLFGDFALEYARGQFDDV